MKKQLIEIWCGIATWIVLYGVISVVLMELRLEDYGEFIHPLSSMLGGFVGGFVVLSLSKERRLLIQLIPLAFISIAWMIAFPTPSWKSYLWFNWPLWGTLSLALTIVIGQRRTTR